MTRDVPQAVPPKIRTTTPLTYFAITVFAFVICGSLAFIYFFNPNTHGFYPTCLFHQMTGLNCPGCGSTRALYALLHGQFLTALRDNAVFVGSLAGGTVWGARFLRQKQKNPSLAFHLPTRFVWGYLVIAVIFTILRNLPAFSFLSP